MSYAGRQAHPLVRGHGIFAAAGLGRVRARGVFSSGLGHARARGIFSSGLGDLGRALARGIFDGGGLGQAKPGTTDHTASDWATALTTGGSIVGSVVGAATGHPPASTTTTTEELVDPAAATAPPVSASPGWYWPVVIGVGVAVLGGIAYMSYNVKGPVKSNRRRRLRRNYAYGSTSHPSSYDSQGRPRRNGRRRRSRR